LFLKNKEGVLFCLCYFLSKHFIKMKFKFLFITLLTIFSCQKPDMKIDNAMLIKLEEFKQKEKFQEDMKILYPGIGNEKLKPLLTEKINLVANDFQNLIKSGDRSEADFQEIIKNGLNRFSDIYFELDTENRERVCSYFEELMDIVGLKSSNGQLNKFMYGFEPEK